MLLGKICKIIKQKMSRLYDTKIKIIKKITLFSSKTKHFDKTSQKQTIFSSFKNSKNLTCLVK